MLIDAGASKNQANYLGWTPLHEACFYHRIETVKTLLLAGADPSIRTTLGALPYHLTGLQEIKTMLESMGGKEAIPAESDKIDMVKVLTELTNFGDPDGEGYSMEEDNDEDDEGKD
jgi:ankyrin repeat protein